MPQLVFIDPLSLCVKAALQQTVMVYEDKAELQEAEQKKKRSFTFIQINEY